MDYLISVSHSDFHRFRNNMDRIIEICTVSGFPGIEGHHSLFEGLDNSELEEAGEDLRDGNVRIPTFHLPGSLTDKLNLVSPDIDNGETAVKIYEEWIEKAALIGFKKAVIHGTTQFENTRQTEFGILFDRFSSRFEKILEAAQKHGVVIALENQNPSVDGRFSSRAEHLHAVLKRFESEFFGFCFDFGHAYIAYSNNLSELYDVMQGHIEAVHVHGNYGKDDIHLPPGYGNADWDIVKTYLKKINIPFVDIESSPHPSLENFFPSDWKKLYTEVCELFGHGI